MKEVTGNILVDYVIESQEKEIDRLGIEIYRIRKNIDKLKEGANEYEIAGSRT